MPRSCSFLSVPLFFSWRDYTMVAVGELFELSEGFFVGGSVSLSTWSNARLFVVVVLVSCWHIVTIEIEEFGELRLRSFVSTEEELLELMTPTAVHNCCSCSSISFSIISLKKWLILVILRVVRTKNNIRDRCDCSETLLFFHKQLISFTFLPLIVIMNDFTNASVWALEKRSNSYHERWNNYRCYVELSYLEEILPIYA